MNSYKIMTSAVESIWCQILTWLLQDLLVDE